MDKKVLYKISYGLYVISSKSNGKFNGQIANTLFQITSEPPTVAVSINKSNLTHEFIKESRLFGASILSNKTPLKFIGLFGFKSGRDVDKFADVGYEIGVKGIPIVTENSIGYIEVEVKKSLDVATHTIFAGEVVGGEILKEDEPLTYAYYHEIKRGVTPKTAPTYIGEKKEEKVQKYRCTVCGYIYDPEKGDPESGIKPGTSFEKLPDDWVCPICGAGKDVFEEF